LTTYQRLYSIRNERHLTSQGLYCKENYWHETKISARKTAGLLSKPVHFTAKGPIGPLRRFRRPVMTKTNTKAKATTKESASAAPLIVLGYDENNKPRAARFPAKDADLVTKAAQLMDLRVYEAASEDLAALAKKLPEGRLYGNGRGFMSGERHDDLAVQALPDVRQPTIPSDLINRDAANWWLLLAIAELAGGEWPKRAREAAERLTRRGRRPSEGVQLLAAFKDIFATGRKEIPSENVVAELHKDPTSIWAEYKHGGPITQRQVAHLLDAFDIDPVVIHPSKRSNSSPRGYKASQFLTFSRGFYLPIRTSAHCWTRSSEKTPQSSEERRRGASECADVRIESPLHRQAHKTNSRLYCLRFGRKGNGVSSRPSLEVRKGQPPRRVEGPSDNRAASVLPSMQLARGNLRTASHLRPLRVQRAFLQKPGHGPSGRNYV
jgi:hypothetical protein